MRLQRVEAALDLGGLFVFLLADGLLQLALEIRAGVGSLRVRGHGADVCGAVVAAQELRADFGGEGLPAARASQGAALLKRFPRRVAEGTDLLAVLAFFLEMSQAVDQAHRRLEEILDELRRLFPRSDDGDGFSVFAVLLFRVPGRGGAFLADVEFAVLPVLFQVEDRLRVGHVAEFALHGGQSTYKFGMSCPVEMSVPDFAGGVAGFCFCKFGAGAGARGAGAGCSAGAAGTAVLAGAGADASVSE